MNIINFDSNIANDMINDDVIQPFQLVVSGLRGRLVRMGPVLDELLGRHAYPEAVASLVAETLTLSLLLSSMLKFSGIFTLQINGEGPVSMLVADVTDKGNIRACAKFDEEAIKALGKKPKFSDLIHKGYIAFTVDQGGHTDRYQGIVEIKETGLLESVRHYFDQSEQIGTGIELAIGQPNKSNKGWRAGAILLQHVPDEGGEQAKDDRIYQKEINHKHDSEDMEEDWRRANILLETCKPEEFLSTGIDGNDLLVRLFHEEGVRVYEPIPVEEKCRCSEEKTRSVLGTLSKEDIEHVEKNGKISISCEFCSRTYEFDMKEFVQ